MFTAAAAEPLALCRALTPYGRDGGPATLEARVADRAGGLRVRRGPLGVISATVGTTAHWTGTATVSLDSRLRCAANRVHF